jgi:predicted RecB family nuclease
LEGQHVTRKIPTEVLEAHLDCKLKGYLKQGGQQGTRSDYEALLIEARAEMKRAATEKILARHQADEVAREIPLTAAALKAGLPFILDPTFEDDDLSLRLDGLKRVEGPSKLGGFLYVPMLFHGERKVGKRQRLLLEVFGLLLSRVQGRAPAYGVVWHGPGCRATRVRLNPDPRNAERVIQEVRRLVGSEPPRLVLNDHCQVCEFRRRCHDQAVQEDSISLLRGLGEKEVRGYARKGILTLTQLAHTFRPRRKGKRQVRKTAHRYHALQALAVRDKRVYVFGTPELPDAPVKIYLDVEGKPDEGLVYLIGMLVVQGGTEQRFSFWADDATQERDIFERFLAEVGRYDDFRVFCYGGYERAFLKRMRKVARRKREVDRVLERMVNVLSVVYAHVYFPCHSNGLKDVAGCLGCSWTEPDASGVQSIVWRTRWEQTGDDAWKDKLLAYNEEDCVALKKVTEVVQAICSQTSLAGKATPRPLDGPPIERVQDIERWDNNRSWTGLTFAQPEFEEINRCSYFDYQRERVYLRSSTTLRKSQRARKKKRRRKLRVTKRFVVTSRRCPWCKGTSLATEVYRRGPDCPEPRTRRAYDLVMTPSGVRRKVIEVRASVHRCLDCGRRFIPEALQRLDKHFHGLKCWVMYHHVVHQIGMPGICNLLQDMFGLRVALTEVNMFKGLLARYYRPAYERLLAKILAGHLLHVDETEIKLRAGKGYVWVLTNLEEVVFLFRPTREGDFLKGLVKDFRGVLVSDFYAAYDSIDCPQQKCLIHLMRDLNQDLLAHPYDDELKSVTEPFGTLLRAIVATVDEHGLRQRHLGKHAADVKAFFRRLGEQTFRSEVAEALRQRLLRYRDKLFTFLNNDGVPWNNNNAEHAVKVFARYREHTDGQIGEKGLPNYLVLLSLYQTCQCKGVSFLGFLKSGGRDVDAFCERRKPHRSLPAIQLYPKGFTPLHILRWQKKWNTQVSGRANDAGGKGRETSQNESPQQAHPDNPATLRGQGGDQ